MKKKSDKEFIQDSKVTINLSRLIKGSKKAGNDSAGLNIDLNLKECKSVILHPSLLCPLIMTADDPIRIQFLTDKTFLSLWKASSVSKANNGKDPLSWDCSSGLLRTIARCLKINTFTEALDNKDIDVKNDKPLFDKNEAEKNIKVKFIGLAGSANLKNQSGDEKFEAIVRSDVLHLYKNEGLKYIFQIDIYEHNKTGSDKGELYNISWITNDPKLNLYDSPLLERQDEYSNKLIRNGKYTRKYPKEGKENTSDMTHAFIIDGGEFRLEKDEKQPIRNYHPIFIRADKKPLNIGQLTDVHVSSRQHAFTKSKAELIHGSNTNIIGPMVNTSYAALKDLMDQFGDDSKIDLLMFTGDLIDYNRNYHPKKFLIDKTLSKTGDIWKEMFMDNLNEREGDGTPKKDKYGNIIPNTDTYPGSIDNVIMYSLFIYYYKTYKKPIFLISGNHECYTAPFGISPRIPTSRGLGKEYNPLRKTRTIEAQVEESRDLRQFDMAGEADKKDKDGNIIKEGKGTKGNRANEGVPADHNLTFGEATLMYGPSFHSVVMFGGLNDNANTLNFKASNLDWFYTIFTPLSDYSFTWGKQCFIALEWGDGERMVVQHDSQSGPGGILPRSTKSLTSKQHTFVKTAVNHKKPCTILLTHFTLANYEQKININQKGIIDIDDGGDMHGKFDYGTFEKRRNFIYKMIDDNKIHFALSGHSHRSALYQSTGITQERQRGYYDYGNKIKDNLPLVGTKEKDIPIREKFNVTAFTAESNVFSKHDKNKAKIIVSAAGGPIPVQNFSNEFANWGLALPSGSYLHFMPDGKEKKIGVKTTNTGNVKAAKPRLAVALDFGDVLGSEEDDIGGFFSRLESIRDNDYIYFEINPKFKLPNKKWVGEVIFWTYETKDKPTAIKTGIKYKGDQKYLVVPTDKTALTDAVLSKTSNYISIRSDGTLTGKAYDHYNQASPWQFRIEMIERKVLLKKFSWRQKHIFGSIDYGWQRGQSIKSIYNKMRKENGSLGPQGLHIDRDKRFGETPKHQDYSDNFSDSGEYDFNWGTDEIAGDTK